MSRSDSRQVASAGWPLRLLGASGGVLAGLAVALAAYAAHGADEYARVRLAQAAVFAFGHGLALSTLTHSVTRLLGVIALLAMFVGVLLFAGSLVAAALAGLSTALAPFGGMLMIGAWFMYAWDRLRG